MEKVPSWHLWLVKRGLHQESGNISGQRRHHRQRDPTVVALLVGVVGTATHSVAQDSSGAFIFVSAWVTYLFSKDIAKPDRSVESILRASNLSHKSSVHPRIIMSWSLNPGNCRLADSANFKLIRSLLVLGVDSIPIPRRRQYSYANLHF